MCYEIFKKKIEINIDMYKYYISKAYLSFKYLIL